MGELNKLEQRDQQIRSLCSFFYTADGSVGALVRLYAFIFLYSFPVMNTITAVHTAAQTSTNHSGTAPL